MKRDHSRNYFACTIGMVIKGKEFVKMTLIFAFDEQFYHDGVQIRTVFHPVGL